MKFVLFVLLVLLILYSRFINLDWDRGWGFHPDENNLWGASRRVELFNKLDPRFYAYGGFPIYLYSLLGSKAEARAVSAAAQTLIVFLLFVLGKKLAGWPGGIISAGMGTSSAGLIQAEHFLTVESLLGLFSLMIIWLLLNYEELLKKTRDRVSTSVISSGFYLILAAIVLGLGIGTKISFMVFILPFISLLRPGLAVSRAGPFQIIKALLTFALSLLVAALIFLLTNPFILTKWSEAKSTLEYETKVAAGKLPVFYTRQFIDTIPGWFQAVHVFPYITGWLFLPMVIVGAYVVCFQESRLAAGLLATSLIAALLSFLPFWAKWTRYVVQILPVLILVAGVGAAWIWEKGKGGKIIVVLALASFLPQFFYTLQVYAKEDTRIQAAKWAEANIPKNAKIFTEAMDLGILPFNPSFGKNIKLFNFYELDEVGAAEKQAKLASLLDESDYFILLSRRVYKNSFDHPGKFPRSAKFYQSLFDGSLGYNLVYQSPLTPYFLFLTPAEETFEVFDNPKVVIFKK